MCEEGVPSVLLTARREKYGQRQALIFEKWYYKDKLDHSRHIYFIVKYLANGMEGKCSKDKPDGLVTRESSMRTASSKTSATVYCTSRASFPIFSCVQERAAIFRAQGASGRDLPWTSRRVAAEKACSGMLHLQQCMHMQSTMPRVVLMQSILRMEEFHEGTHTEKR
jgi:hypothetical protein